MLLPLFIVFGFRSAVDSDEAGHVRGLGGGGESAGSADHQQARPRHGRSTARRSSSSNNTNQNGTQLSAYLRQGR